MVERLTKLDVAKRRLRTAIYLVFHEQDAVAVHTVVAAAHQILDDLCYHKGLESLRKNPYIRPGKEKRWIEAINAAQNFFKHADHHPDAVFQFNHELPRFYLADALRLYWQLTQESLLPGFPDGFWYLAWFGAKYPDLVEDDFFKSVIAAIRGQGFDPENFQRMRSLVYSEVILTVKDEGGDPIACRTHCRRTLHSTEGGRLAALPIARR